MSTTRFNLLAIVQAPKVLLGLLLLLPPLLVSQAHGGQADEHGGGGAQAEPQFPPLFDPFAGQWRARIVSEIIDDQLGYQTSEELVDVRLGKASVSYAGASASAGRQGGPAAAKETLLCDSRLGRIFKYKPYTCTSYGWTESKVFEEAEEKAAGKPGNLNNWSFEVTLADRSTPANSLIDGYDYEDEPADNRTSTSTSTRTLRLFGVAGLWMLAQQVAKVYSRSELIFSTSRDIYRESHNWSFEDRAHDLTVTMHFIDANIDIGTMDPHGHNSYGGTPFQQELSLEMIQLKSLSEPNNRLLRTINVLAVEHLAADGYGPASRHHQLELPVGYGCLHGLANTTTTSGGGGDRQLHDLIENQDDYVAFALDGTLIELELTQTKMAPASRSSYQAAQQAVSRTVQLVLAQSTLFGPRKPVELLQVSGPGARQELKTVYDYEFNTKYAVDLRRGACTMSHIAWNNMRQDRLIMFAPPAASSAASGQNATAFEQSGGISLERTELELLFVATTGFRYVKRTIGERRQIVHLYFERELERWPFLVTDDAGQSRSLHDLPARIVRQFAIFGHEARLASVTVWLFSRQRDQLLESYHFNVIDEHRLESPGDVHGVFDISEECYLQNELMRAGQDYAWVELFYPAGARLLDVLASRESYYRDFIRSQLLGSQLIPVNALRLPRLELMFDDDGLVVRLLLLDRPSLDLIYQQYEDTKLSSSGQPSGQPSGATPTPDHQIVGLLAPDLRHCVDMCELHACTMMSYCPLISSSGGGGLGGTSNCLLLSSERPPEPVGGGAPGSPSLCERSRGCTTLVRPPDVPQKRLHDQHLAVILSKLQHQDYDSLSVPSAPDELLVSRAESNLDEAAYQQARAAYLAELERFLAEDAHRAPELSFVLMHQGHLVVLLPARFRLEEDPLDKWRLAEREAADTLDNSGAGGRAPMYDAGQESSAAAYFERGRPLSRYNLLAFPGELAARSRRFTHLDYDRCALACLDTRCGSFSYCTNTNECIITSVNSTTVAYESGGGGGGGRTNTPPSRRPLDLIRPDNECAISYRNFLASYQRFANVLRPQMYRRAARGLAAPSDCALECVSEAQFNCLSFEACLEPATIDNNFRPSYSCFYQTERQPADIRRGPGGAPGASAAPATAAAAATATNCDHYERSPLASFNQIAYRQLEGRALARLETATYEARSVYECADICLSQLADCSAFQFCLNVDGTLESDSDSNSTEQQQQRGPMQVCTMILGSLDTGTTPAADTDGQQQQQPATTASAPAGPLLVDSSLGGQLVGVGAGATSAPELSASDRCHLFALRRDTGEAHARQLALGETLTLAEAAEASEWERRHSRAGLSPLAGSLLLGSLAAVSMAAGFGLRLANERSERVRRQVARLRLLVAGSY